MAAIDFTEIPTGPGSDQGPDQFELFARDFLQFLGFHVVVDPCRGADGGMDLVVKETRQGIGGTSTIRWLVSCKHFATSGRSVKPADEPNIVDRLHQHECTGFLGFYSTVLSSGLGSRLETLRNTYEVLTFDCAKIERYLLASSEGRDLARRYAPTSAAIWLLENRKPASVYTGLTGLPCAKCGRQLAGADNGIVVVWYSSPDGCRSGEETLVEEVYCCCKGVCDHVLRVPRLQQNRWDKWEDIADIRIPAVYIKWAISTINEIKNGQKYSQSAFDGMKELLLELYPYICRDASDAEEKHLLMLSHLPPWI